MPRLKELNIQSFRNIEALQMSLSPEMNFFYGENGAGKTSILEALHFLGTGKSFRTPNARNVIQHGAEALVVFTQLETKDQMVSIGLSKASNGETQIKIDRSPVNSASELVKSLPVLKLDAANFRFLEGAPSDRRTFFEWLVFHVEPQYIMLWKSYQSCLKQRNTLLRRGKIDDLSLEPWDAQLVEYGSQIEALRSDCFDKLSVELAGFLKEIAFLEGQDVELGYLSGWYGNRKDREDEIKGRHAKPQLLSRLLEQRERDLKLGYSSIGSHKFDLCFRSNGKDLSEILSRGQKKTLLIALTIVSANLYFLKHGDKPVLLLDDLSSELDDKNLALLTQWLQEFKAQSFITSVSDNNFDAVLCKTNQIFSKFHVEHGKIKQEH